MPTDNTAQSTAQPALTITRTFAAPIALLFKVWTDNEHLKRWCCPTGFTITHCEGDIRPGGHYRSCMRSPLGEDFWLRGTYRELVPNQRLVFTHSWEDAQGNPGPETVVTITFEERGKETLLILHQAFFTSTESRDGHQQGWEETLDNLHTYL